MSETTKIKASTHGQELRVKPRDGDVYVEIHGHDYGWASLLPAEARSFAAALLAAADRAEGQS